MLCLSVVRSFFLTGSYSTVYMYDRLFIHVPIDEYLSCFHFLAVMNKAAVCIHIQAFGRCLFPFCWINIYEWDF